MLMVGQRVAALFDEYYREIVALMGGWQRSTHAGERTMMFDMATLEMNQARLRASGSDELSRSLPVPMLPEDPRALANVIAAELNVQLEIKQELLELPSPLARLQREAEILAEDHGAPQAPLPSPVQRVRTHQLADAHPRHGRKRRPRPCAGTPPSGRRA
jgi:hypothetical protein